MSAKTNKTESLEQLIDRLTPDVMSALTQIGYFTEAVDYRLKKAITALIIIEDIKRDGQHKIIKRVFCNNEQSGYLVDGHELNKASEVLLKNFQNWGKAS